MPQIGPDGRTYATVLPSHKSLATFRVCSFQDHAGEVFYGCAHPGHAMPHDVDYLVDCPTLADAQMYAAHAQESADLMESIHA